MFVAFDKLFCFASDHLNNSLGITWLPSFQEHMLYTQPDPMAFRRIQKYILLAFAAALFFIVKFKVLLILSVLLLTHVT